MFLSWLPILGPIIEGTFSFLNKKEDATIKKTEVDGEVRQTEVVSSVKTLEVFKDDITVRLARDIIMFPVAIYTAVATWDYFIVLRYPELVWGVKRIPPESGLEYLIYAVLVFLFGNLYLNRKQQ